MAIKGSVALGGQNGLRQLLLGCHMFSLRGSAEFPWFQPLTHSLPTSLAFLPCPDLAFPRARRWCRQRVADDARNQVRAECGIGFRRMRIGHRDMDAGPARMPAALSPHDQDPPWPGIGDLRREIKRYPAAIFQG